jgi:hypothetical protein
LGSSLREPGLKISDRLVSISDPDARPIRKGKLGRPTDFGYVVQICEVTENTRCGARGLVVPAAHAPGNPAVNRLLTRQRTSSQSTRSRSPGATNPAAVAPANAEPAIAPGSRTHQPPQTPLRAARSRLKGDDGMQTWTGWAILAYDLDTLAIRAH